MVTFRNNNNGRRNSFRRNDRNYKSNGDRNKFSNNFSNSDNFQRKVPGRNNHNASKLIEKYNNLAREALSVGDKILSENYFQHADHYRRVIDEKNFNQKKIETQNGISNTNPKEVVNNLGNNESKPEVSEVKKENQNT